VKIDDLTETVAAGFIPEDPAELHATIEGLPGFCETLARKLDELAEWAGGQGLEQAGTHITDMAVNAGAAKEAAAEAFLAYQDETAAWRE
jgi:hypothetical protein